MGRFLLALGYVLTGDERLLNEYNSSFRPLPRPPIQAVDHALALYLKGNITPTQSAPSPQLEKPDAN